MEKENNVEIETGRSPLSRDDRRVDEQETWAREKRFFKQKQMSFSVPVIIKRDKYDRIDQWLTVSAEKEQNVCNSCTKSARVKEILPHVRRRAIVMAVSGEKWRACFLWKCYERCRLAVN